VVWLWGWGGSGYKKYTTMSYRLSAGWLDPVRRLPSPNCDQRPADTAIDLLVVHNISLPPGEFGSGCIDALFTNRLDPAAHPAFRALGGCTVSAHLLIDRGGRLTQYVPFHLRAWHAGESCFQQRVRCNDFSIGIELEGCDEVPYEPAQYQRLAEVIRLLQTHYPALNRERIVGHSDIAPQRKTDPGKAFDWAHLSALLTRAGEPG